MPDANSNELRENRLSWIEVGEVNVPAVTAILQENRYTLFDGPTGYRDRKRVASAAWNTIAIPDEKLE